MAIKIFFLAANPSGTQRLNLDQEIRAIDSALRQTEAQDLFDVRSHWAVHISDLQGLLLRHQPEIVHFSGHGSERSEIILLDENNRAAAVPARALSDLFGIMRASIRCVVLNACYSAHQAAAIAEHVDCVIGMTDQIADRASLEFAAAFYRALGYGRSVQSAFDLGRNQIHLSGLGEMEGLKLFAKVDPTQIRFATSANAHHGVSTESAAMNAGANTGHPWWTQLQVTNDAPKFIGGGDVIVASIGPGSRNVAVGKNVRQVVHAILGEAKPDDEAIIQAQFAQARTALRALQRQANAVKFQMAEFQLQLLESELTKTEDHQVPSATTIVQVGDRLLDDLPLMAGEIGRLLALPAVGRVIAKAGDAAVQWVQRRFAEGGTKS